MQQRFVDQDTTPGIIVWERESGTTAADRALATQQLAEVTAVPKVVSVTPLIPSQDGKALQAVVQLAGTDSVRSLLVPALVYEVGRPVWWPSRLARREEPEPADVPADVRV